MDIDRVRRTLTDWAEFALLTLRSSLQADRVAGSVIA